MCAVHTIASRQGLDLAQTLRDRFGIDRPDDLAISEASQFIDDLKAPANGTGGPLWVPWPNSIPTRLPRN